MKKSIASVALLVSATSAHALPVYPGPNAPRPKVQTYCLDVIGTAKDGSLRVDSCDQSANNAEAKREILENGCADGQVAIHTTATRVIRACMPIGVVQL